VTTPWRRLGPLALDTSQAPWAVTHAALPVLTQIDDDRFDLYVSLRDGSGRSRIGRAVLSMAEAPRVSPLEPEPILDLGPLGAFDDAGVTTSCIVSHEGRQRLYYTGWCRGVSVPFYLAAGLVVRQGRAFERISLAPLLDRSAVDPFLTASPFVIRDGQVWRMWYVSASEWRPHATGPRHYYHIRYADSRDGVTWHRTGRVCVDYAGDEEYAFGRPCVVRDGDAYRMWYSVRGERYRIGYAESNDGIEWTRHDGALGLLPGTGWESDMVEYPFVFDWQGRRYMLYNGNGYGRTGVGLAVLEYA
jgi:hypothetical protein